MSMSTENSFEQKLFDPYTYFETSSGLLAYTYGHHARYKNGEMICAVVGYFTDKQTGRVQSSTGRYVEKIMYEGNKGNKEFEERFKDLPTEVKDTLRKYSHTDEITGEKMVLIPYADITLVYSPKEALQNIINGNYKIDIRREKAILELVNLANKHNIEVKDLGLYGSLQTGIISNDANRIDIDLLIYGISNYKNLQDLIANQNYKVAIESKYRSIREFEPWFEARKSRDSVSKIFVDQETHADVRLIRNPNDPVSFDFQSNNFEDELFESEGRISDVNESLTIPTVYKVIINNQEYIIGSRVYVYVAAAKLADNVLIKGRRVKKQNSIVIVDPKSDYIYPTK